MQIWITEAEHHASKEAAAAPRLGVSVARFVAEAALVAAGAAPPPPRPRRSPSLLVLAEVADAVAAVNRVGNNLNQLAREKNATGRRPTGTFEEIEHALAALEELALRAEGGAA